MSREQFMNRTDLRKLAEPTVLAWRKLYPDVTPDQQHELHEALAAYGAMVLQQFPAFDRHLLVMREAVAGWECSDPESCDERRIICPRCRIRNYLQSLPAPPEGGAGQ